MDESEVEKPFRLPVILLQFAYHSKSFFMLYHHLNLLGYFLPDPYRIVMSHEIFLFVNTDKNITKGKLVIDVAYFIFHVHSETHNLCDETPCPATGEFVLASQQTLPSFTPPVSIMHHRI